jgi:hypothetical protein
MLMKIALKFSIVCVLALIGALYHKVRPKRRDVKDYWFV